MNIIKINVEVEKKNYTGLYWLTEAKGQNYLNVSFADIKKISKRIDKKLLNEVDQIAKNMLHDLIENMQ